MNSLVRLEDLPIGVSADEVMAAFAPFIDATAGIATWNSAKRSRAIGTARRALGRAWGSLTGEGKRDKAAVSMEYEEVWSAGYRRYNTSDGPLKPVPWTIREQHVMAAMAGAARFRSIILGGVIATLRPRNVLEVGCGDGINLLLLAGAFPEIQFIGLELTEAGNSAARNLQSKPEMPEHLVRYAPLAQKDATAFQRISLLRGDACKMAFSGNSFDLVFTILSIEQMERVRDAALREIARVTGGHLLNMEPFEDANRHGWKRLNVFGRNYFRGKIADLPNYGLTPLWATSDYPQEALLGTALVLSRKSAAGPGRGSV